MVSCGEHPAGQGSSPHELLVVREIGRNWDIFAMHGDGSHEVRLTHHPARDDCPRWSPDGRKIVFRSFRDSIPVHGGWERIPYLYVMNANGSNVSRLTQREPAEGCGTWSPDGRKLVFGGVDQQTGRFNIFTVNADGSNLVPLTGDSWDSHSPQWSPNGTAILFLNNRETWSKLAIMNPDGSGRRPFGEVCFYNVQTMRWSPDESQIVYDCSEGYGSEVYTIRADGTGRRRISAPAGPGAYGDDQNPVWFPDGKSLGIARGVGGNRDVYRIDLVTRAAVRITTDPNIEWPSDWRERGRRN